MIDVSFDADRIDAIFASFDRCSLPGAAVGIAMRGRTVYRRGFGLANMELPIALSPAVRMRIASISKQFTAFLFLLLCEEGLASIDAPIGEYLPDLHPVQRAPTIRELLGHRSGLRDAHDIAWQLGGTHTRLSSADLLRLYQRLPDASSARGSTWIYNNGGYLLVSAAIERIVGQPLEHVFRERVFEPLRMYDTALKRSDLIYTDHTASLHVQMSPDRFEKSEFGTDLAGEGGMLSTVDDMLRWLAHMDVPTLGSPETWRAMREPQRLNDGASTGYGLGLIMDRYRGVDIVCHGGTLPGGSASMIKVSAVRLDVIVICNRSDAGAVRLAQQILDVCLPSLDSVVEPVRPAIGATFHSSKSGRVVQMRDVDGCQIASIDGYDVPLVADCRGGWRPASTHSFLKYHFDLGDDHSSLALRLDAYGSIDTFERITQSPTVAPEAIAAKYRCDTLDVRATIEPSADGLQLRTASELGTAAFDLQCLRVGLWRAKAIDGSAWGGILAFDADAGSFTFSSERTRALPFRRIT